VFPVRAVGATHTVKIFLIAIGRRLRASVPALREQWKRWLERPAARWFAVAAALLLAAGLIMLVRSHREQ
jgi:hypothetical protein